MKCDYCGKDGATHKVGHLVFCSKSCADIYFEDKKMTIIYDALRGKKKK